VRYVKLFKGFLHGGKVGKHCLRALNKYVLLRPRRSWLKDSNSGGGGGIFSRGFGLPPEFFGWWPAGL